MLLLRARNVLPISRPPIADGAVLVDGNRIRAVGTWAEVESSGHEVVDLGESILLPGLVNAHCHLDYTGMAGRIVPTRDFAQWIKAIMALKGSWTDADYARSWIEGARELVESGCTSVADIEAVPANLLESWNSTPLRVTSFLEMTCVRAQSSPQEIVADAIRIAEALPTGRSRVALSPHAPYSTLPELLQLAGAAARDRRWPVTAHLSESVDEFDMFMYRRGPLFEWLRAQRDMGDCGIGSPVQALDRAGLLAPNFLAVHVNYLWEHDDALLARSGSSVVHCPLSHSYFGHRAFPHAQLANAGVNLCLGTDSSASLPANRGCVPRLSLFDEMQEFTRQHPQVLWEQVVRMATINGARALGQAGELGELSEGSLADLIAIPMNPAYEVHGAVVHHRGPVSASMIEGVWAIPPAC